MNLGNGAKAVVCQELTKVYAGASRPALDGLNISIRHGEVFGLLGPNGAGKTTTVSILSTLLRPTRGSVSICGINAIKYPDQIKKMIGLVAQEIALYPDLTARENLSYFGRLHGLKGQLLKHRICESLELVGLIEKADQRITTYSGGMKRRANLAAGILHQPKILFLDEPTVGIDAQSRNMILSKLALLNKNGATLIYTTHYMEEAEILCSRVAIIDKGRRIDQGTPQKLIENNPDCANLGELYLALTGKKLRD